MAEQLTLPQQVQHAALVDQFHGSPPDDPHVLPGLVALAEDRRAGGEELDLRRSRQLLDRLVGHVIERSVPSEELGYVVHRWAAATR